MTSDSSTNSTNGHTAEPEVPILGPRNIAIESANPDLLVAPGTDAGTIPNLKFPYAQAHNRVLSGGWAREVTTRELPVAKDLAGVNMRLKPGGIRELHWHKEAEWAYMIAGTARVTAVDAEGRNFIADVGPSDLWYFPAGIPHSIQGLEEGCEFLLVFDDGNFSENETFLITDWFAHTPRDVLAKNLGVPAAAFDHLPENVDSTRYIFDGQVPPELARDVVSAPAGAVPQPFVYRLSEDEPIEAAGGRVRIVDSSNFHASKTIAAAVVEVDPGCMRELHWHPNAAEWQYYLSGQGRMTVFASSGKARTFDYQAGDVGYIPYAMGHYVENTGDEPLVFLEVFKSDHFADVSLNQWMALLPPELVQAHLNIDSQTMSALSKDKPIIVAPKAAHRQPEGLPEWPARTIAVLTTVGEVPRAIPVTAPVRAGDRQILISLNRHNESLQRLRECAHVALTILAQGNEAFTARGRAQVIQEPMAGAPQFAAVLIDVDELDDHRLQSERVESGVAVSLTSKQAERGVRERVDALEALANGIA
jgi:oxalate decarboxylase